ncbi:hypothetical protein [Rhizobium sp. NFR07]|uniref:hypothetical protein n=1 Tax=Rhizobium sp. NFR07 TaxID=1566262 RepID=UPI0011604DF9|nr:hypothetical protein [Rhizobium sp. NFR07]
MLRELLIPNLNYCFSSAFLWPAMSQAGFGALVLAAYRNGEIVYVGSNHALAFFCKLTTARSWHEEINDRW